MKRAVDIGPLDAAAIKTGSGKVRLRLLFSVEQLEALLRAARDDDDDVKHTVTHCNAPGDGGRTEERESREEVDDDGDARAPPRPPPTPAKPIDRADYVFVIEGSRAWQAWIEHRGRHGQPRSMPTTTCDVSGKWRRGWYLPTLFPPGEPQDPLPADAHEFAK